MKLTSRWLRGAEEGPGLEAAPLPPAEPRATGPIAQQSSGAEAAEAAAGARRKTKINQSAFQLRLGSLLIRFINQ